MGLFNNNRKVYLIHKMGESNFKLCKVLNEYNNADDAHDALTKLLTDEVTEKQLLRELRKKNE